MTSDYFIELDYCQIPKKNQNVSGDVFLCKRLDEGNRVISVLADGLGSGVEAATLAKLTASMAMQYVSSNIDILRSGEILMDSMPIDRERQISYSTFSIADVSKKGTLRILDHGNSPFFVISDGRLVEFDMNHVQVDRWNDRFFRYCHKNISVGDRVVFISDGISLSGLGRKGYSFGWTEKKVAFFILSAIEKQTDISARQLSQLVTSKALQNDLGQVEDDLTCGVIYFRKPRKLLVVSGPPYDNQKDKEISEEILRFQGKKIVCGGTTSNIISRELKREIKTDLADFDPEVPVHSSMEGVDLITEGMLTMSKVVEFLKKGNSSGKINGATKFTELLLESDSIEFIVGTSINEAHQDPTLPIELDIRRNVIKKIVSILKTKYLKQVNLEYV